MSLFICIHTSTSYQLPTKIFFFDLFNLTCKKEIVHRNEASTGLTATLIDRTMKTKDIGEGESNFSNSYK